MTNALRRRAFSLIRHTLVGALIVAAPAAEAQSRRGMPELPSIELNLDVLKSLENETRAMPVTEDGDLGGKKLIWQKGPEKKYLPEEKMREEAPKKPIAKAKPQAKKETPVSKPVVEKPVIAVTPSKPSPLPEAVKPEPKPEALKPEAPKPLPPKPEALKPEAPKEVPKAPDTKSVPAPLPENTAPKPALSKSEIFKSPEVQIIPAPTPGPGAPKPPLLQPVPKAPLSAAPNASDVAPLASPVLAPAPAVSKPQPLPEPMPLPSTSGHDPALKELITQTPPAKKEEKPVEVKPAVKPAAETKKPEAAKIETKEPAPAAPLTLPPIANDMPMPPGLPTPMKLPEVNAPMPLSDKEKPVSAVTLPEMKVTETKPSAVVPAVPLAPSVMPEPLPVPMANVPSVTAAPMQPKAVAPSPKEEEGWFPNIKKSVKNLFGEEEKMASAPVIVPAPAAEKLPATLPPPPLDAPAAATGLPPLPAFTAPSANMPPSAAATGNLPSLSPVIGNQPNAANGAPLGFMENPNEVKSAALAPALPPLNLPPAKEAPKEMQVASAEKTPAETPVTSGNAELVINFDKETNTIGAADKDKLTAIAQRLKGGSAKTARVVAYMSEGADSTPRRIALSRGLEVRAQMIQAGVDPTLVNVEVADKKKRPGATANMADVFVQ